MEMLDSREEIQSRKTFHPCFFSPSAPELDPAGATKAKLESGGRRWFARELQGGQ